MQKLSETSTPKTIHLSEYQPPAFRIEELHLTFDLKEGATIVKSRVMIEREADVDPDTVLQLDGEELSLLSIKIDNVELDKNAYTIDPASLTIHQVPGKIFCLEIETQINPEGNTSLSGLYLSSGNFCTQCEAEGFRKITYFLDRPDVMTRYTTRVIADKTRYPVLLSNGNCIGKGEMDNNQHWFEYQDPFPKPSYLFALVAGDLSCIEDKFVTMSDRNIALYIYVEAHNIDKCDHAMKSLQNSMKWDEEVYGREYDLDTYVVVAVDDFNMGAMENKGLNVFNSKYVLAKPQTATDSDYQGIEGVIGHEYFHNWSGNRVTCRDWFQLSLKEGFTVFRDQEFSADMTSRSVKRIEDVNVLRIGQYREDAGPMAHPVRPESYVEINNFYTATVYNKGAEVVRMLHNLLGPESFRRGTDLYFDRHDGQAVTTDDFVKALEDASGIDLTQFRLWYSQAGTPELQVNGRYNADNKTYTLSVRQDCPPTPGQNEKSPFQIPLATGLLDKQGNDMPLRLQGEDEAVSGTRILNVKAREQEFTFVDVESEPVPSVLRGFSAPIKLDINLTDAQRCFLMSNDNDGFNRWEAGQQLFVKATMDLIGDHQAGKVLKFDGSIINAIKNNIEDARMDNALIAQSLALPAETYISEFMNVVDPDTIHYVRNFMKKEIARSLKQLLLDKYESNKQEGEYSIDSESTGKRSLKNMCLTYLMQLGDQSVVDLCIEQFYKSNNMTDTISAFSEIVNQDCKERESVIGDFYDKWKDEALVTEKWFGIQATSQHPDTLKRVRELISHSGFSIRNPNKVRALIGAFSQGNQIHFHSANGEGYSFLGDFVIKIDAMNPQIASRLVGGFSFWKKYDSNRQQLMIAQLERIRDSENLSRDVYEIVTKSLGNL